MKKLEVGDKVKIINNSYYPELINKIGIIVVIRENSVGVEFPDNSQKINKNLLHYLYFNNKSYSPKRLGRWIRKVNLKKLNSNSNYEIF